MQDIILNTKEQSISDYFENLFFNYSLVDTWVENSNEYSICEIYTKYLVSNQLIELESAKIVDVAKHYEDFFVLGKNRKQFFTWLIWKTYYVEDYVDEEWFDDLAFSLASEIGANSKEIEYLTKKQYLDFKYFSGDNYVEGESETKFKKEMAELEKEYDSIINFNEKYSNNRKITEHVLELTLNNENYVDEEINEYDYSVNTVTCNLINFL